MIDKLYEILTSDWVVENNQSLLSINVFIISFLSLRLFRTVFIEKVKKIAKKTSNEIDDLLIAMIDNIGFHFYLVIPIYIASLFYALPLVLEKTIFTLFISSIIIAAIQAAEELILKALNKVFQNKINKSNRKQKTVNKLLELLVKTTLWTMGLIMILQNLGYDVTTLLGGLGILGLTIGIGLQSIARQIFSFFSIIFDDPFEEGDFIVIGDHKGTVKKIGVKTTRLTAVTGQELVISNKDLTETRVENYKKMKERTEMFKFRLEFGMKLSKLKKVEGIVADIIGQIEGANLLRVHFSEIGKDSLIFNVAYKVLSGSFLEYKDIQQTINFRLMERFENEGIKFAYPTSVIFNK